MNTKEKIFKAAIFVFGRTPSASVTEVAKKAEVSRMTVNRYFTNKENLLLETYEYCIDCFQEAIDKHKSSKVDDVEKLQKVLWEYIDLGDQYSFLMRNSDEAYDEYGQRFKDQLNIVTTIVKRAQRKGLLRKDLPEGWIACIMDFSAFAVNSAIEHGSIKPTNARDILWKTLFCGIKG
jgi:AcrR family transcriptional regulator